MKNKALLGLLGFFLILTANVVISNYFFIEPAMLKLDIETVEAIKLHKKQIILDKFDSKINITNIEAEAFFIKSSSTLPTNSICYRPDEFPLKSAVNRKITRITSIGPIDHIITKAQNPQSKKADRFRALYCASEDVNSPLTAVIFSFCDIAEAELCGISIYNLKDS